MNYRVIFSLQITVIVLALLCVCESLPAQQSNTHSRVKRGFRANAGNRMAHGFGKRGGHVTAPLSDELIDWLDESSSSLDAPISSADDFSKLLLSSPELTRVVVAKFLDLNGDDVISSDELFRSVK